MLVFLDLAIDADEVLSQAAKLTLLGDEGRFAPQGADRQCAVGLDEFPLQSHETATAAGAGGHREGRLDRVDNPDVGKQLLGERRCLWR